MVINFITKQESRKDGENPYSGIDINKNKSVLVIL